MLQRAAVNRSKTRVPLARRWRKQGYKSILEWGLSPFRKLSFAGRWFGKFVRLVLFFVNRCFEHVDPIMKARGSPSKFGFWTDGSVLQRANGCWDETTGTVEAEVTDCWIGWLIKWGWSWRRGLQRGCIIGGHSMAGLGKVSVIYSVLVAKQMSGWAAMGCDTAEKSWWLDDGQNCVSVSAGGGTDEGGRCWRLALCMWCNKKWGLTTWFDAWTLFVKTVSKIGIW